MTPEARVRRDATALVRAALRRLLGGVSALVELFVAGQAPITPAG